VSVSASPIDENGSTTLSGGFSDPGVLDTHTVVINWGDTTSTTLNLLAGVTAIPATSHTYLDNRASDAAYTISVQVTDKDGASLSAAATTTVTVNNVAPSAALTAAEDNDLHEGNTLSFSATATDAGPTDQAAGFTFQWRVTKNGAAYRSLDSAAGQASSAYSFVPDDNGEYVVSVTATDKDGLTGPADSQTLTVLNVAPSAASVSVSASPIDENGSTTLSGSFSDPGVLDTHTVVINWGDTTSTTLNLLAGVTAIPATSHTYLDNQASDAAYTISVQVTDKDGASLSAAATTTVTVNNVAPSAASVSVSASPIDEKREHDAQRRFQRSGRAGHAHGSDQLGRHDEHDVEPVGGRDGDSGHQPHLPGQPGERRGVHDQRAGHGQGRGEPVRGGDDHGDGEQRSAERGR